MLFTIDESRCRKDGVCAVECPLGIIEFSRDGSVPRPSAEAEALCISCGHCVAVCPHGALSHRDCVAGQCLAAGTSPLAVEDAILFMKTRRSVRRYREEPVDRELLGRVLDTARFAPTGHNSQTVRWIVVYDTARLRELTALAADWLRFMVREHPDLARSAYMDLAVDRYDAGEDAICRNAPHLVMAFGAKTDHYAQTSCIIALSHAELAAHALGLGACWAGYFNAAALFWPPLGKALGLADDTVPHGALMLGRPVYRYRLVPERKKADTVWL